MKAILYTKYGPPEVLQLHDVEKPSPADNEVLVKVHAASVNALEWRRFTLPMIFVRMMGGGVGTFAVQIAKSFGAEVTAVCGTGNVDIMRGLGADHVIDYTREDFTKNGRQYDRILAVNGYHPILDDRRAWYWDRFSRCLETGNSGA